MSSTSAIALSGMNAAQVALQATAHNIANLGTAGFRREQVVQTADPSGGTSAAVDRVSRQGNLPEADMVGLLQARKAFLANLAVFKASDRMAGSLLDALV
jgi:flagellar hook protein FlgE